MKIVLQKEIGVELKSAKKMASAREKLDEMDETISLLKLMSERRWNDPDVQIWEINNRLKKVKANLDEVKYLLKES